MDPWHVAELFASGLLAVVLYVWRSQNEDVRQRLHKLEGRYDILKSTVDRGEERDAAFTANIERLSKAIEDFDTKVGAKIDQLTRVVNDAYRRFSPPRGIQRVTPVPREDNE